LPSAFPGLISAPLLRLILCPPPVLLFYIHISLRSVYDTTNATP
jgi:hypothetical protein